jgi:hypothetical protein
MKKMKKIMFTISAMVVLTLSSFSQTNVFPIDANGEIVYSGIVNVDSINSKELYVRAHTWFANTFKSAQSVIQLDDKDAGKIIGKGFIQVVTPFKAGIEGTIGFVGNVYFTLDIQTKDGKYKYVLSNFSYVHSNTNTEFDFKSSSVVKNGLYQKKWDMWWQNAKINTNTDVLNLIESLKKAMNTNNSNW